MLSFEIKRAVSSNDVDQLEVYCDRDGLESLIGQLKLLKEGRTEHVELMAGSWGGTHLDESPRAPNNVPVRHVKVLLRNV
jgi:hypothetical protein